MQTDEAKARCLKCILDEYCAASGQVVYRGILFSSNTQVEEREVICHVLNILTKALTDKYLGLPSIVGADRSGFFSVFD
jgi:hypothetical protein